MSKIAYIIMYERFLDQDHNEWAKKVKIRDKGCLICRRVHNLHSHHYKYNYASHPEYRYDLTNGVTLCSACHELYHDIYGKVDNNEQQFIEFMIMMKAIQKITEKIYKEEKKDGYTSF